MRFLLATIWGLLGLMRRSIAWMLVLVLLTTNILAFTSAAFVAGVSALAGAVGVTTTFARQQVGALQRRAAIRQVRQRVAVRTARGAARTLSSAPLKAVPVAGVAAVVAFTSWELYDACQTMRDLAALDDDPGEGLGAEADRVCGLPRPKAADLAGMARGPVPAPPPQ